MFDAPASSIAPGTPDLSRRSFLELGGKAAAATIGAAVLTQAGRAYPAETGKKLRMAVVGGGFGASFHWHEHPDCVVTAVTDLYPGRRKALQARYKCDNVYDSLETMLKQAKDIDAVAVFAGAALGDVPEVVVDVREGESRHAAANSAGKRNAEPLPVDRRAGSRALRRWTGGDDSGALDEDRSVMNRRNLVAGQQLASDERHMPRRLCGHGRCG